MKTNFDEATLNHFFSILTEKKKAYDENYKYFAPKLAPKFNVFNFVRRDENALSFIILNLLDPKGDHEQGSVFLELFISLLESKMDGAKNQHLSGLGPGIENAKCTTESTTSQITNNQRRIDIVIDFGNFGIGIENKPWAFDQKDQLLDYSKELESRYKSSDGKDFLLVYLTGGDWKPEEYTIPAYKLQELNITNRFVQINFEDIESWLLECEAKCKADRVRNFLRDFVEYCGKEFGRLGNMERGNMTIDFALKDKEKFEIAFEIGRNFDEMRKTILTKFIDKIRTELSKRKIEGDVFINEKFGAGNNTNQCIGIRQKHWQNHAIAFEYGKCAYWGVKRNGISIDLLPVDVQTQILSNNIEYPLKGQNQKDNSNYFSIIGDFEKDFLYWFQDISAWEDMYFGDKLSHSIVNKYEYLSKIIETEKIAI